MKSINRIFLIVAVLSALIIFQNAASAQKAFNVVVGREGAADDEITSPDASDDDLYVYLEANKSYECSSIQRGFTTTDPVIQFETSAGGASGSLALTSIGEMTPVVAQIDSRSMDNTRVSIIPTTSGVHTIGLVPVGGSSSTDTVTLRCDETTLYGEFNTNFGNLVIAEVQNFTSEDIVATIRAVDFAGVELINPPALLTVGADTRADAILLDIPVNRFGKIIITHPGTRESLKGWVSEYDNIAGVLTLKRQRPTLQSND